jgi:hypothetical protein
MHLHLHLHITPNTPGQAILDGLLAAVELRETLAERLEAHMAAALRDAVYDLLPHRAGIDNCEYEVSVDSDTLPALLLACQAALYEVEQGRGNTIGPLLTTAMARATHGRGMG